jgi:hypothetical protein
MVSAVCLCADNRIISSYSEDLYGPTNKMFSSILILPFIFFGFRFYGRFLMSVRLNVLCSFRSISMIISSMLLIIGRVIYVRLMY